MRIITHDIEGIPTLEIVQKDLAQEKLPLIIFQHGGTNDKHTAAGYGVELAKRGFRAILPDALKHGQNNHQPILQVSDYFEVWEDGVNRLPRLINYFQKTIKDDFIGVGGLSMGGFMTNMQMVKYPEISAAVSLMGAVDTAAAIKVGLEEEHSQREAPVQPLASYPYNDVLVKYNLGNHLESIAQRPMYFWHSKDDNQVPFRHTYHPVKALRAMPAGNQVEFEVTDGDEHVVPNHVFIYQAEFFKKAYDQHLERS